MEDEKEILWLQDASISVELYKEIKNMVDEDEELREIWGYSNRIQCADFLMIIKLNLTTIGFILAVKEKPKDFLFFDMGLKKEYRSIGYGKVAIIHFLQVYQNYFIQNSLEEKYLIGETKSYNYSAINTASVFGKQILDEGSRKYFLMNGVRWEELKHDYNKIQEFLEYVEENSSKTSEEIYKSYKKSKKLNKKK